MKIGRILKVLISVVISTTLHAGNENGGGGNTLPSTPASINDIKINLETIRDQSYAGFLRLKLAITNPGYFNDNHDTSSFRPIIERIVGAHSDSQIQNAFYSFTLETKMNASCYDQGVERDASADISSNRICVSLQRLADKDIPFHDLSFKLTALMIHEVSHLLMVNETDAIKLQMAFESYGKMITPAQIIAYKKKAAFDIGYDTPDLLDVILEMLQKNESDTKLCFKIGQLDGLGIGDLYAIKNAYLIFGSSIFNEATLSGSDNVWDSVISLESYCGQSGESENHPEVPRGNRKALKTAVLKLKSEMQTLMTELTKAPFPINCDNWNCE